jgi:CubicO group peptidase (beta-lactamase class C family)
MSRKKRGHAAGRVLLALLLSLLLLDSGARAEETYPSSGGLTAKLQPFVDEGAMAGAVMLVGTRDKILDLEAVGYSDLAAKTPMKVNDMFWIASMNKAMTASLMMMLFDEGKVGLDDPAQKYLPEFQGQMVLDRKDKTHTPHAPSHPSTIRELLSHASGLPYLPAKQTVIDTQPLAEAVAGYAKSPLVYDPGSQWMYSNEGIATAGRIVEVLSGIPYEKFMQQRLFDPLGMTDTTFWPTDEQVQRLAKAYTGPKPAKPGTPADPTAPKLTEFPITYLSYPLTDRAKRFPMPAGGLFSTAVDVARFCRMFLNDGTVDGKQILSPQAVKLATTNELNPKVKGSYGFGWSTSTNGNYNHGGAYATYMGVEPSRGLVMVLLIQQGGPWGTADGKNIRHTFIAAAEAMAGGAPANVQSDTVGQGQH